MQYFSDPGFEFTKTQEFVAVLIHDLHQSVNLDELIVRSKRLDHKSNFSNGKALHCISTSYNQQKSLEYFF